MNRQLAPLFMVLCCVLSACGGGGSTNPPPPPPPAISVSFSTPPPSSLGLNATADVAVTVSNDSTNSGVTFSCTPAGACGTFSSVTSTSATYNSPASVPSGGSATIIATSVADTTKSAQKTVTITGPTISVAISQQPPPTMVAGAAAQVAATITNDSAGVDWTCIPTGSCGSFAPANTATGIATTYTAPPTPLTSAVTITATSHSDATKKASTTAITITKAATNAALHGQYAFLVLSPTGDRGTAAWVGSVNLDGNGGLAAVGGTTFAGIEDVVSPVRDDQNDSVYPTATNAASKYAVGSDGRGYITMATQKGELLTIRFVISSTNSSGVATHAEIIEADGVGADAGNPGSGTMDLQTLSASISGTYSVILSGVDAATPYPPVALGGVFNFTAGTPTTVTGTIDTNANGSFSSASFAQGQIDTPPDSNGRGTFHIVPANPEPARSFAYYVVSSKVVRIFESGGVSFTGGSMYSQGVQTGAIAGTYVYQHSGWSNTGRTVAAGLFRADAAGGINTGISDCNRGAAPPTTAQKAVALTNGGYTPTLGTPGILDMSFTDAAGASTFKGYMVDSSINILDPNSPGGGGGLLLHTDNQIIGTGVILPQQSPSVFSLNHAVNLVNSVASSSPKEIDLVGILTSDSSANFLGNLADYARDSPAPIPQIGAGLEGTFTADSLNPGRYTGTLIVTTLASGYSFLTGSPLGGGTTTPFSVAIYQATASQAFVVETDTQSLAAGQMLKQNLQ